MVEESFAFTRKGRATKSTRIARVGSSALVDEGGLLQAATAATELMSVLSKKGKVARRSSEGNKEHNKPKNGWGSPENDQFYWSLHSLEQFSGKRIETLPLDLQEKHLTTILKGCAWEVKIRVFLLEANEDITTYPKGFTFVFTYPFTLIFKPSMDPMVKDLYKAYNICLGQLGPALWR